mmetsp:Transcript_6167/g.18643  ORF Transcript_6167/g.18643 Transcript_6167/m.18643 type:complete len:239 (-) Transcript_6167:332-1048(-)
MPARTRGSSAGARPRQPPRRRPRSTTTDEWWRTLRTPGLSRGSGAATRGTGTRAATRRRRRSTSPPRRRTAGPILEAPTGRASARSTPRRDTTTDDSRTAGRGSTSREFTRFSPSAFASRWTANSPRPIASGTSSRRWASWSTIGRRPGKSDGAERPGRPTRNRTRPTGPSADATTTTTRTPPPSPRATSARSTTPRSRPLTTLTARPNPLPHHPPHKPRCQTPVLLEENNSPPPRGF